MSSLALYQSLTAMGADVSQHGIDRLLGAPIATSEAATASGGHIDKVTINAVQLCNRIKGLHKPQAQYGMLLYCASTSMTHLARLLPPHILGGFASRLREALLQGLQSMLTLQSLTYYQRAMITLPTRSGGLGLTSAYDVMIQAYIASHGATIRQLKKTEWPESSRIAQVLLGKSSIVDATDQFNTMIRETEHDIKFKLIDHARPDIWPTQSVLSAAKFQIKSAELEN